MTPIIASVHFVQYTVMMRGDPREKKRVEKERESLLSELEKALEGPMVLLSFLWLLLVIAELTSGLSPSLETTMLILWAAFSFEFILKLIIAPAKWIYLREHGLTALSLILPALRMARLSRILPIVPTLRAMRLVKVLSSANRTMRALRLSMRRRGLNYVVILTLLVTILGAAAMRSFEPKGLPSYASALWWTAMVMTTMGSDFWPQSTEGRILCLFLAMYAFTIFGYVTASLASFFIGSDTSIESVSQRSSDHATDLQE